ncbi:hypothetical protein BG015_003304 [Linnemannia schmuckeri]|uniref:Uncharacterized protein n=1 Tax=Linnemannia schmuckeri TaxID=64567 RepID=A0A9P5V513_9FUNG|nr:hypothetical protein BG015_003304 [Linnemannia schmuckeri]
MKGTFTIPGLFLLSLLVLVLTPSTAHAGPYTLTTPTSATRWTPGQPGAITLLSTDKAKASTKPTDRLLTITLRLGKGGIFGGSTQVAVIRDGVQLLVPFKGTENQVKLDVTNWVVPPGTAAGDKYFVQMVRTKEGFFDIPDKVESAFFQIVAAPVTPPVTPPPANTTGPTLPTPTLNTTTTIPLPTPTTTTPPTTPTLPPGQTCADIQAQCAAKNLTFIDTNSTAICQCGPLLIMPVIIDNGASAIGGGLMVAIVGLGLSVLMSSTLL